MTTEPADPILTLGKEKCYQLIEEYLNNSRNKYSDVTNTRKVCIADFDTIYILRNAKNEYQAILHNYAAIEEVDIKKVSTLALSFKLILQGRQAVNIEIGQTSTSYFYNSKGDDSNTFSWEKSNHEKKVIYQIVKALSKDVPYQWNENERMVIQEYKDHYYVFTVADYIEAWYEIKKDNLQITNTGHNHLMPPPDNIIEQWTPIRWN